MGKHSRCGKQGLRAFLLSEATSTKESNVIVFENPGEIDIRSISTFGVSVKEGANPIGFFGTGLKYAIAVLLRTGHRITVMSGLTVVNFGIEMSEVRGQKFDFVTMKIDDAAPVAIGFTTELGKQWEVWMAYREIACNCKDENGEGRHEHYMVDPEAGKTMLIVQGDEFESIFATSHKFILEDQPWLTSGTLEIRNRPSSEFFYRGVRVSDLRMRGLYCYCEQAKMELTEDRTIKSEWEMYWRIANGILHSTDKQFLRAVVTAPEDTMEGRLDYGSSGEPSLEFLEVVGLCMADRSMKLNASALKVWQDATKKEFSPRQISLTSVQQKSMDKALDFCERIGFTIRDAYPIHVVESLGEGCLGLAKDETIFIAERVFHLGGAKQLASTLIEEYLHLRHGWKDMTRELQSFLFDKLVSIGEELVGEPL